MKERTFSKISARPLWLLMLIAPFLCGGFYEAVSCLFSVHFIGYLVYCYRKTGILRIQQNFTLLTMMVLTVAYGVSTIWAVDHGMAILGFIKFLPLPMFVVAVMQIAPQERAGLLKTVPLTAGVMVVFSFCLGQIPTLKNFFFVNNRLAGFFQYPNTFALFLLAGVIVLIGREGWNFWQFLCLAMLFFGILQTGSRTVFVLLIFTILVGFIRTKNRKFRGTMVLLLCVVLAGTMVYAVATGNMVAIGRYLKISVQSSTFLGRLLYIKDALPVILRHPFGTGYMGYFSMQGAFQTGVYSVRNVHNELLQIFLDVGWVPAGMFVAAVVKSVISKQCTRTKRMLLLVISTHCMFDFDLQFILIFFVFILAMDLETGSTEKISKKSTVYVTGAVLGSISVWLGIASGLYDCGKYQKAVSVYPGYTSAWLAMLPQAEDTQEMEYLADKVLSLNDSASLAYSAKSRTAYATGNFSDMIDYKQQAISLSKYRLEEYLDYFDMLYVGIQLYMANGDIDSAEYCRQCLLTIPDIMENVLADTDKIAWQINDKPNLTLPEEYREILESLSD